MIVISSYIFISPLHTHVASFPRPDVATSFHTHVASFPGTDVVTSLYTHVASFPGTDVASVKEDIKMMATERVNNYHVTHCAFLTLLC